MPKDLVVNIDATDMDNELAATEYIDDIYKFYKLTEDDGHVHDYMASQPDINAKMSQVKCLCCGYKSNKVDEIMDISLDVFHSNSLRDSMQKFFQPEVLDGNNKYKCDGCKKLVAAKKQMSILKAPNVLVIHLKRFEGILGGKIDKAVAFEEFLVLSSFMCKASQECLVFVLN